MLSQPQRRSADFIERPRLSRDIWGARPQPQTLRYAQGDKGIAQDDRGIGLDDRGTAQGDKKEFVGVR